MGVSAKQERSKLRVAKIIEAAHQILLTQDIDDITISNLAIHSDLKRTSTYKFFANALKNFVNQIVITNMRTFPKP